MIESEKKYVNNPTPTIQEVLALRIENEQLKEKLEYRNCIDCSNHGKQIGVLKLKAQIEKMKNCANCKNGVYGVGCMVRAKNGICNEYNKWECVE